MRGIFVSDPQVAPELFRRPGGRIIIRWVVSEVGRVAAVVGGVAFSPDGTRLATFSDDGTARIYTLSMEELMALARTRVTRTLTTEECQKYLHLETCP